MGTTDLEDDSSKLAALLSKQGNRASRRYELKRIDGRLMLMRNEIDRIFESVMSELFGTEFDPDDKDGKFLD